MLVWPAYLSQRHDNEKEQEKVIPFSTSESVCAGIAADAGDARAAGNVGVGAVEAAGVASGVGNAAPGTTCELTSFSSSLPSLAASASAWCAAASKDSLASSDVRSRLMRGGG